MKTDDGGVRDKDNTYTWDNAMGSFVTAVNATGLCGFKDWRLPSIKELTGIINYGIAFPGSKIDLDYFPKTPAAGFWSASAYAGYSTYAWYVYFSYGYASYYGKSNAFHVRLVRAGQYFDTLIDNQDGTVTHEPTGLMWAKCSVGQTSDGSSCTGSASSLTWIQALAAAKNLRLANHNDWRLPNIKELMSLVDYNFYFSSINIKYFPNTPSYYFWSASAYAGDSAYAWYVNFDYGYVDYYGNKDSAYQVRLVRAGQSFDFLAFNLNISKLGTGNGKVISNPVGIDCGTDCTENYTLDTKVTLKATPSTGSIFTKWSGACTGISTSCVVTMDEHKTTTASFLTHPAAPVIGSVAGNTQVTLNWAAVAGATSYNVYQGVTTGGESTTPVNTDVTATSVIITGLDNGTKYFFKMAAVNAAGTSALSNEVGATPRTRLIDFVITKLSWRPVKLSTGNFDVLVTVANQGVTGSSGGFLDIWANQAKVQSCGAEGDAWTNIGILAAGASKTVTLTLKAPTGGTRTLRAFVDSWCETVESNEINNQLTQTYVVAPAAPIISVVVNNRQVTLKWSAVTGATSYKVFQGVTAGGESTTPVKTCVTGTSVIITGLTNGKTYFFTLAAVNSGGTSARSNEISATPAP
ncbi:conserved hypothetical protein [Gammaproteobacteria bacterium]